MQQHQTGKNTLFQDYFFWDTECYPSGHRRHKLFQYNSSLNSNSKGPLSLLLPSGLSITRRARAAAEVTRGPPPHGLSRLVSAPHCTGYTVIAPVPGPRHWTIIQRSILPSVSLHKTSLFICHRVEMICFSLLMILIQEPLEILLSFHEDPGPP